MSSTPATRTSAAIPITPAAGDPSPLIPVRELPKNNAAMGAAAAKKMMEGCIVEATKGGYTAKIASMIAWFKQNPMTDQDNNPVELFESDNTTLKLPIPVHAVLAFFGYIGNQKVDETGKESSESEIQKSSSTMGGYRSALVWHYKQNQMKISEELDTSLSTYMSGYKRTITALKLRGVMSVHEGKRPLEFPGFVCLAGHFLKIGPTGDAQNPKKKFGSWAQQLFAWPFFVLCWNMMARSVTVGNIMYQHISWSGDAMTINVPGHKGDKEGAKDYGRHIYANPLEPAVCQILSLAVMIFSTSFRTGDKRQQLFEGNHSESRFSSILRDVVDSVTPAEERILGAKKKDIGTHSPRKGSPSYALAMIEGPNPVQVFLRAGWSLGNVQDRYLFAGKGGDQLVGRTVCGLPMHDESFGALPPHFTQEVMEEVTEAQWLEMLPNYASYPNSFRCTLPFLLASVVYHNAWLRANLDARHPLFNSRLYTAGYYQKFADKVLTGNIRCEASKLVATGVPYHIMQTKAIKELGVRIDALECGMKRKHVEVMDALADLKTTLPQEVRKEVLDNFEINGAVPITQDAFNRALEGIALRLEASVERRIAAERSTSAPEVPTTDTTTAGAVMQWNWGGRMNQMVPEGFRMPECNVKCLWDLWHFGHKENRVGPYRHLRAFNFKVKTDNSELSKARSVMSHLHVICGELGSIQPSHAGKPGEYVSSRTLVDSDSMFKCAYEELATKIFKNVEKHRLGELRFNYVYNLLGAWKKNQ